MDTVRFRDGAVVLIDQRLLPNREVELVCRTAEEVAEAIRSLAVRGAPAIGVTAGYGIALGLAGNPDPAAALPLLATLLGSTRPTAVNLFWAIDRMRRKLEPLIAAGSEAAEVARVALAEAEAIREEDLASCRAMGDFGAALLPDEGIVLTHCNAGGLATAGYGTALGVIRSAIRMGKRIRVYADETRPFLQGARLTAWELHKDGIPVTVITDNMAGHFLSRGEIRAVVVGADRIARNGDTANKIGTYGVAVLAKENGVPFYVAAPLSTIDPKIADGSAIPIEERSVEEVTMFAGVRIAPEGVPARHPAFDVTPNRYISAIVTERGVLRSPYGESIGKLGLG
jgi:methylthioribose-1-phosphate isomerase